MELNECVNFLLTRTQNTVFNHFKSKLATLGVTPVQYALLKCLWDNGDQSPTQIAHALCLDSSTVTGIIARMEGKDLIERIHSNVDRRAVNIRIKPLGAALQPDIERTILEANQEVLAGLENGSFLSFKQILSRIEENVGQLDPSPAQQMAASGK